MNTESSMSPKNPFPVLACLFVLLPVALTTCPSEEDLHPCTCDQYFETRVTCKGLKNEQDVTRAARSIRGKRIFSFTISDSSFNFIPHDAFKGVQIRNLYIESSTLKSLSDTDAAFVGLEDHLHLLKMKDCVLTNGWDWSVLRKLKTLNYLYIQGNRLTTIGEEDFITITSMEDLFLRGNEISFIHERAFVSLKNIGRLDVFDNEIKELKRTMLPNPANEMWYIDISFNLIEQLPDDMFTNMPMLDSLYIDNNRILVLNEKTFSPVWEQLEYFSARGIRFRCDCHMSWLLGKRFPRRFIGAECDWPQKLKHTDLSRLTSKDLVCYT